jgi:hypothetical protein
MDEGKDGFWGKEGGTYEYRVQNVPSSGPALETCLM